MQCLLEQRLSRARGSGLRDFGRCGHWGESTNNYLPHAHPAAHRSGPDRLVSQKVRADSTVTEGGRSYAFLLASSSAEKRMTALPAPFDDDIGRDDGANIDQEASCWICLGDAEDGELQTLCKCPNRPVHGKCLARWCLQSAGREWVT